MKKNSLSEEKKDTLLIQDIKQSNKKTKNILNIITLLGSSGFLIVGISSYLNQNIIEILQADKIIFFPQGLVMSLYGTIGLILSINQILINNLNIGEGYNEFNKETNEFILIRKNTFSKNIKLIFSLKDIVRK